jgi:ketosteroid isomerase-like protein
VKPWLPLALGALALAGCAATSEAGPARIAPAQADVAAISAVLDDVYGVISGPVGQRRDFARMRTLFTPDARLTAIGPRGLSGGTLDDYVAKSGPFLVSSGFTERALVNRIEVYGDLAQAWSSYEGTFTAPDGKPGKVRGINSFQLMRDDDGRWLVQSIFWQAESPDRPLPADMEAGK